MVEQIRISVRTLGELNLPDFCPGCFWIKLHCRDLPFQIPTPGIFSTIDGYVKKLVHTYFDQNKKLPPWFPSIGGVERYVPKLSWRWFYVEDKDTMIHLTGVPDDIFEMKDGTYHIVDYKTAKITDAQDELFPLYEVQLNGYAYIAEQKEISPVTELSLVYTEPLTEVTENDISCLMSDDNYVMRFRLVRKNIKLRIEMIRSFLKRARQIYDDKEPQEHTEGCKEHKLLEGLLAVI